MSATCFRNSIHAKSATSEKPRLRASPGASPRFARKGHATTLRADDVAGSVRRDKLRGAELAIGPAREIGFIWPSSALDGLLLSALRGAVLEHPARIAWKREEDVGGHAFFCLFVAVAETPNGASRFIGSSRAARRADSKLRSVSRLRAADVRSLSRARCGCVHARVSEQKLQDRQRIRGQDGPSKDGVIAAARVDRRRQQKFGQGVVAASFCQGVVAASFCQGVVAVSFCQCLAAAVRVDEAASH